MEYVSNIDGIEGRILIGFEFDVEEKGAVLIVF